MKYIIEEIPTGNTSKYQVTYKDSILKKSGPKFSQHLQIPYEMGTFGLLSTKRVPYGPKYHNIM